MSLRNIIEAARRQEKVDLGELTVLTAKADPYRLDTPAGKRDGNWFAEQVYRAFGDERVVHLRGVHYAIVVAGDIRKPDGSVYRNVDEDWTWLCERAAKCARWLGHVPFERIADNRNNPPEIHLAENEELRPIILTQFDVGVPCIDQIGVDINVEGFVGRQPYQLAIFGEKSSVGDVVRPLAQRFGADLYLPSGEMSDSMLFGMAKKGAADGRPLILFTIADCDPAGRQMPVSMGRKLQALRDFQFPDLDFEVRLVALEPTQARELGLPSTPLKETERRADRWREAFGIDQTEIDALAALQPDVLEAIVEREIAPFFDSSLAERVDQARERWLAAARRSVDEQIGSRIDTARRRAAPVLASRQAQIEEINREIEEAESSLGSLPDLTIPVARDQARGRVPPADLFGLGIRRRDLLASGPQGIRGRRRITALAMIAGKLYGAPVTRDTRTGGKVTFNKLRVVNGSALDFWDCATFSDAAREELDGLKEGDALSAVGALRVETFEHNGEKRVALKLTTDRVMAIKPKPKETKPARVASARTGNGPVSNPWDYGALR